MKIESESESKDFAEKSFNDMKKAMDILPENYRPVLRQLVVEGGNIAVMILITHLINEVDMAKKENAALRKTIDTWMNNGVLK